MQKRDRFFMKEVNKKDLFKPSSFGNVISITKSDFLKFCLNKDSYYIIHKVDNGIICHIIYVSSVDLVNYVLPSY